MKTIGKSPRSLFLLGPDLGIRRGAAAPRLFNALREAIARLGELLLLWQGRARQRAHLAALDDRLLRDIGLTRADVERELLKPFWRA
jgi:uncharacterized protein YjiS (DUF1127 family)